jgi:hypothetical protein
MAASSTRAMKSRYSGAEVSIGGTFPSGRVDFVGLPAPLAAPDRPSGIPRHHAATLAQARGPFKVPLLAG